MGKKSKRNRTSSGASRPKPPALRQPFIETKDDLRFEDPFVDEIVREEDEIVQQEEEVDEEQDTTPIPTKAWNPFTSLGDEEELEINVEAYKMHHALSVEWPSLSFDFIRDSLGESRTRFPHSLTCVAGTQAPLAHQNYLAVMKLSDLDKIQAETEDDILGEELGKEEQDDDDDDESSDDEDVDLDPCLEHYHLPHDGGVNRVRTMPQQSSIIATWSDTGKVHMYNVQSYLDKSKPTTPNDKNPIFTHSHGIEGFAMDWSTVAMGQLATGDCHGGIHIWTLGNSHHFHVSPSYQSEQSVEDLQWSPTESTVLAAAECAGHVKVYDIRAPHRAMLSHAIGDCDINVLAWNRLVGNLVATGHDDGALCVWDLRNTFKEPLARFTSHKTPITSVEWHPTDESMLVASDDNGVYIYDLSVEEDECGEQEENEELPTQLLFVHSGSSQFKEVHWHPQIASCCMTTSLNGFSIFIPSNL
jgi:ribosome assembly protein RRB1